MICVTVRTSLLTSDPAATLRDLVLPRGRLLRLPSQRLGRYRARVLLLQPVIVLPAQGPDLHRLHSAGVGLGGPRLLLLLEQLEVLLLLTELSHRRLKSGLVLPSDGQMIQGCMLKKYGERSRLTNVPSLPSPHQCTILALPILALTAPQILILILLFCLGITLPSCHPTHLIVASSFSARVARFTARSIRILRSPSLAKAAFRYSSSPDHITRQSVGCATVADTASLALNQCLPLKWCLNLLFRSPTIWSPPLCLSLSPAIIMDLVSPRALLRLASSSAILIRMCTFSIVHLRP